MKQHERLIKAIIGVLLLTAIAFAVAGCVPARQGAIDDLHSQSYDTLLFAQALIEAVRPEIEAGVADGTISEDAGNAFNVFVEAYNVAKAAWDVYSAANRSDLVAAMNRMGETLAAYRALREGGL